MRTTFLSLLLLGLLALTAGASDASGYEDVMRAELARLDSAAQPADYLQCRNRFERMAQMYAGQWLPVYYTAYCDLQMTYMKQPNVPALLQDAKALLEKLEAFDEADPSEVQTLWGYYYMALIATDPSTGQTYFMQTISSYEKAMKLNPANPRPVCLLAFFRQQLPPAMRSGRDIAEGKQKAEALFRQETPSPLKPYWGAYFLQMIRTENN
ncbi:MAG: hypothetical protein LBS05_08060 [Tannerellaceae bacterium]|jgi:hypothetical protein|nr:hypothetical protein [Tannerellaceae bacterium]